jgi:hypothetical protein
MKSNLNTTRVALSSLLFLVFNSFISAQETPETKARYCGGFGYFTFSSEMPDLAELNNSLKSSGFEAFGPSMPSWGGGGMFVLNNFLIGGQGAGFFSQTTKSDNSSAILRAGYGQASFGYLFRTNKRSVLLPVIGIGGGGMDITVGPDNSPGDFSSQLNNPVGTMNAQAGGWFLSAELTYNYFFLAQELQGFFIGARAGYRYAPNDWKFNCNGQSFTGSPGVNLSGPYVTILIGGGGIGRN